MASSGTAPVVAWGTTALCGGQRVVVEKEVLMRSHKGRNEASERGGRLTGWDRGPRGAVETAVLLINSRGTTRQESVTVSDSQLLKWEFSAQAGFSVQAERI